MSFDSLYFPNTLFIIDIETREQAIQNYVRII